MEDLTVKTLKKAVEWIVNCAEDVCQVCAYYDEKAQASELDKDDSIEPCVHCRANGQKACINGVIEHFQTEV